MSILAMIRKFTALLLRGRVRDVHYELWARWHALDLGFVHANKLGLPEGGADFADSGGPDLDRILRVVPIAPKNAALDVGCGKGGALITLSRYFDRADGIEYSPELAAVARANLAKLGFRHSTVYEGDAAEFTALDGYTVLYLFYPFDGQTLRPFIANLCASLDRRPRALWIIYRNVKQEAMEILTDAGFNCVHRFLLRFQYGVNPVAIFSSVRP